MIDRSKYECNKSINLLSGESNKNFGSILHSTVDFVIGNMIWVPTHLGVL